MALYIVDADCISCGDCEPVCPTNSIKEGKIVFEIDAKTCTECEGDFADPQCATICPIEGAILDDLGEACNPPGSLTGIPPERMAEAMAEIQAR